MLGSRQMTWGDYVSIARRRWWIIMIPTVLVPIFSYVGSLWIPNRYTSKTSVLVEQQKVPDAFVKPVVAEELNQRLATMQEQILEPHADSSQSWSASASIRRTSARPPPKNSSIGCVRLFP